MWQAVLAWCQPANQHCQLAPHTRLCPAACSRPPQTHGETPPPPQDIMQHHSRTLLSPATSGMSLNSAMTMENSSMKAVAKAMGRVTAGAADPSASCMWKKKPSCTRMALQCEE